MNSAEHVEVGDSIEIALPDGTRVSAASTPIIEVGGVPLTYGEIVALGGDFYGSATPISDLGSADVRAARFADAFGQLETERAEPLTRIRDILRLEQRAIADARAATPPHEPSTAYAALGDSLSLQWSEVADKQGPSYGELLYGNLDHFGDDARTAYRVGHRAAVEAASAATETSALLRAYAMNAFADHFLTDLFAAGHVRTPRRALAELPGAPIPASGLLALVMHDEDNRLGLDVTNARGDRWTAYGDAQELDARSARNRESAIEAVQASVDDVFRAFQQGRADASDAPDASEPAALALAPVADADAEAPGRNHAPLFRVEADRAVLRRGGVAGNWPDQGDWSFTTDWALLPMVETILRGMVADGAQANFAHAIAADLGITP
ncbi:phospholipase [Agromyces protaetiae]|uniref:Phospholipase n=1 Tax=Agromyces protaetiae TaxID=2509455 RepID=A0A4V0YGQ5_9MICO|nr:phospholipase [Agromyces protaetiae]QAY72031.1 phospholipase [Agromyces protaetiae]